MSHLNPGDLITYRESGLEYWFGKVLEKDGEDGRVTVRVTSWNQSSWGGPKHGTIVNVSTYRVVLRRRKGE